LTADLMDELLQTSSLHAWDGYKTFNVYMQSEFEIVPVAEGETTDAPASETTPES